MKMIGVTGWKDMGKTTLVELLVGELVARGLRVATIKHAHHALELDTPGRDSYRHRMAGAAEVLVASAARVAIIEELRGAPEPRLPVLLTRLQDADLVVVEGYKTADHPKLEVFRSAIAQGRVPLAMTHPGVVGIVGDAPGAGVPVFDAGDPVAIADFALRAAVAVRR
ncbi:MAG: molybdopterin-guanine dinucleotide biosynthesis protein B [Pseudomonadota bacterium]